MVGLGLMVARIAQVAEAQILRCGLHAHGSHRGTYAQHLCQHGSCLESRLLVEFLLILLCRVHSHGMCNLMTQHDGQCIFRLCDGQQSFIDHDLSTGHTPGIHLFILYQVEFPLVTLQLTLVAIVTQIVLHGCSQPFAHALHHGGVLRVGRFLGRLHVVLILGERKTQHLCIVSHFLCPAGKGHRTCRTAGSHQHYQCGDHHQSQFFHIPIWLLILFIHYKNMTEDAKGDILSHNPTRTAEPVALVIERTLQYDFSKRLAVKEVQTLAVQIAHIGLLDGIDMLLLGWIRQRACSCQQGKNQHNCQ